MANFHTIETGYFWADGGAMFGPIPKRYWQKRYPCTNDNMCRMAMRCLFIETDDRKIVVDCGAGDKQLSRLKFYQPHDFNDLRAEILSLGYSAEEITDVIFTHLHFDHCGGGTVFNNAGVVVPAFPNATYWVSQLQWENYRNPSLFEESSFFPENLEPIFEANQLRFLQSDTKLCENVWLKLYNGHTPGQIVVFLDANDQTIVFPGDVIPSASHTSLGWLSAFDNNAALAMEEKKRLLDEVRTLNAKLIFCHDVFTKMK